MGRLFGTDGIRGIANKDLSFSAVGDLGFALAELLRGGSPGKRPTVYIGKDTRLSSDMLEAALTAGLTAGGCDATLLGVLPTPAVAWLTAADAAAAGVMISASHNPYEYNGIKVFGPDGYKLTDEEERFVERVVLDRDFPLVPPDPPRIGRSRRDDGARGRYLGYLRTTVPEPLDGLRVIFDCANGSASATARPLFTGLGVDADFTADAPDGKNINDRCGSTDLRDLRERVVAGRYDLGLAFDGDADRCLAVDETGAVVDGDRLMAIFSESLLREGRLPRKTAVVTVMSGFGFFRFAEARGIGVRVTQVGDRYVLEAMREQGLGLGGEQSGHIIFREFMTTGDGELTALQLLRILKATGRPLSELAAVLPKTPQVLLNVEATRDMKERLHESPPLRDLIRGAENALAGAGRVLVRASGTEPLIRVMVEGEDEALVRSLAGRIADGVRTLLG